MTALWCVEMFGGLRLQRGETTVLRFRTRQTAALLAYLAYFPRPHSRESLVEQFWPDSATDKGRNNLRVCNGAATASRNGPCALCRP
ncbi:MAG TPA: hypothetical protein VGB77_16960 [Abditibacteriaceae bacterium]